MTFHLYRMPHPMSEPPEGELLGSFDSFELALEARDDDAIEQLACTDDGEAVYSCHRIIAAEYGTATRSLPLMTSMERHRDPSVPGAELHEAREWLAQIHRPR
jgi:hypothetical protein